MEPFGGPIQRRHSIRSVHAPRFRHDQLQHCLHGCGHQPALSTDRLTGTIALEVRCCDAALALIVPARSPFVQTCWLHHWLLHRYNTYHHGKQGPKSEQLPQQWDNYSAPFHGLSTKQADYIDWGDARRVGNPPVSVMPQQQFQGTTTYKDDYIKKQMVRLRDLY